MLVLFVTGVAGILTTACRSAIFACQMEDMREAFRWVQTIPTRFLEESDALDTSLLCPAGKLLGASRT